MDSNCDADKCRDKTSHCYESCGELPTDTSFGLAVCVGASPAEETRLSGVRHFFHHPGKSGAVGGRVVRDQYLHLNSLLARGGARNLDSKISLGTGLLNKKPCISSQPSNRSRRDCSSVSTPSATTLSFSECARLMKVDTSASPSGATVMSFTNERSIFSVSTGSFAR